jgi:hypothetical protein
MYEPAKRKNRSAGLGQPAREVPKSKTKIATFAFEILPAAAGMIRRPKIVRLKPYHTRAALLIITDQPTFTMLVLAFFFHTLTGFLSVGMPQAGKVLDGGPSIAADPISQYRDGLRGGSETATPRVWYVAPDGNDSNPGTFAAPFKTWQKGHDMAAAGDTVWLRGGNYPVSGTMQSAVLMEGRDGTAQQPIAFFNYPGETPVLDCSGMTGGVNLVGIQFHGKWWHLRGLEIKNVPMNVPNSVSATGLFGWNCENTIFEQINIHHCEGSGLALYEGAKNNLVVNCDFHHNYDPETPNDPGGNADGGSFRYLFPTSTGNVMRNCRAWSNSDDGFDFWEADATVTVDHCQSFQNGFIPGTNTPAGNGSGFKMGQNGQSGAAHLVKNCIAFRNRGWGFDSNLASGAQQWLNNTAFENGQENFRTPDAAAHILRNNLAVPPTINLNAATNAAFNSWNLPVTANAADFLSADPTGADGARKPNGDLPETNFLKLAAGSDLIDQGLDVGLNFNGTAPDLGAREATSGGETLHFPTSFSNRGIGGGGYTYAPSVSPHDPNHVFLVCDMAGVYRSLDGAQTWEMQRYENLVSRVKGKVQFTSDPQILYSLSRSRTNFDDPWWRGELVKSVDGGATFQTINDPTATGIHRIEVDPGSTQRMILSEYDRLFFTANGGATWQQVYTPPSGNMWLGGVFWNGQNIYVGTNHGLLVSNNGGANFAVENHNGLPAGSGIYHLAGAKNGSTVRLFCLTTPADGMYAWLDALQYKGALTGVFRMNYSANAAWANARNNIPGNEEIAWVDLAASNTDIVWAAAATSDDNPQIYKSTNGGNSWTATLQFDGNQNISTGWAGDGGAFLLNYNGAALGLEVAPTDPNRVIFSDGNGHATTDGGATWKATYVHPDFHNAAGQTTPVQKYYKTSGLDVTTAHHIFWKNDAEMFVSNTDIGQTHSADGGETWTFARNLFYPWGNVSNNNWYQNCPATHHRASFRGDRTVKRYLSGRTDFRRLARRGVGFGGQKHRRRREFSGSLQFRTPRRMAGN